MKDIKVLLVDDSKTTQIVVSEMLADSLGINNVRSAKDGLEAIEMLKSKEVDLIISDWNMPKMSGEELLYEVKQNGKWKDIPFIMMTANKNRDFIIMATQLGVSDYVIKPCDPEDLAGVIRKTWNEYQKKSDSLSSHIPENTTTITVGDKQIPAQLLHINRSAALIRVKLTSQIKVFEEYDLKITATDKKFGGTIEIYPLKGAVRRIEADDPLNMRNGIVKVSLMYSAIKMGKNTSAALDRFLPLLHTGDYTYIED